MVRRPDRVQSRGGRGTNHGFQDHDDAHEERSQARSDNHGAQSLRRDQGRGEEDDEERQQARRGDEGDHANGNGRTRDDAQGRPREAHGCEEDDAQRRRTAHDGVQGGPGAGAPEERLDVAQVGDGKPDPHKQPPQDGRSLRLQSSSTRERCGPRVIERLKLVPKEGIEPPTRRV